MKIAILFFLYMVAAAFIQLPLYLFVAFPGMGTLAITSFGGAIMFALAKELLNAIEKDYFRETYRNH